MKVSIEIPSWASALISDFTDMERNPHKVDASKVKRFSLELPDDVYFEYAFLDETGERRADPNNPQKAENPWYPEASAILGPAYQPSPYASLEPTLAKGTVTRHRLTSSFFSEVRRVSVYTPAGFEAAALPCLYLQDGIAYQRIANLPAVLEALLKEERIRPAHLVFVEPIERSIEYAFDDAYTRFFKDELFSYIEREHKTSRERHLMGASLGGLFSAGFALVYPELISTVMTQSGAFLGSPTNKDVYRAKESWVLEQVKKRSELGFRWYLETGTLEWLVDINRQIRDELALKAADFAFQERHAGHNWVNWRSGLSNALEFALGNERQKSL